MYSGRRRTNPRSVGTAVNLVHLCGGPNYTALPGCRSNEQTRDRIIVLHKKCSCGVVVTVCCYESLAAIVARTRNRPCGGSNRYAEQDNAESKRESAQRPRGNPNDTKRETIMDKPPIEQNVEKGLTAPRRARRSRKLLFQTSIRGKRRSRLRAARLTRNHVTKVTIARTVAEARRIRVTRRVFDIVSSVSVAAS